MQRLLRVFLLWLGLVVVPSVAFAADNDIVVSPPFTQDEFNALSRELGYALSYFPLATAAPLGVTGFDVGVEATAVNIAETSSHWRRAVKDGEPPDWLVVPKLHAQKGLPFNIDLGAIFSTIPTTNISLVGGEVKWAFLEGGVGMPALAVRGTYTKLLGDSDVKIDTYGVDLSISKGIGILTPYAGAGQVWIKSETDSSALATQFNETQSMTKGFVGLKLHLPLLSVVAEAAFSRVSAYSLRLNISF